MIEVAKNLEDEIAAGSNLKDISEKYKFVIHNKNDLSLNDVHSNPEISVAAENIFEIHQGEVSYPLDLPDEKGLIIVEVTSIKPSTLEEFDDVKIKARSLWLEKWTKDFNFSTIENLAKNYEPNISNIEDLNNNGIKIDNKFEISRTSLEEKSALPQGLLRAIFQTHPGNVTPVFVVGKKAYFAYVKETTIDEENTKNIKISSKENISATIKNGLMEELISSFIKMNKMKINKNSAVFQ